MGLKTVGTKVTDEFKGEIEEIAGRDGRTVSDLIRFLLEELVNHHYEIIEGRLTPTDEYVNAQCIREMEEECPICDTFPPIEDEDIPFSEPDGQEYFEFGFDTLVNLLRKKEYPDEYIKKMAEGMIATACDMPRFNPRKSKGDWGC